MRQHYVSCTNSIMIKVHKNVYSLICNIFNDAAQLRCRLFLFELKCIKLNSAMLRFTQLFMHCRFMW